MGEYQHIEEGALVQRTGRIASVPVGNAIIGRVVNAVGQPIDGKGPIASDKFRPVERIAPGVIKRQPVNTPVAAGITAIDALIRIQLASRPGALPDYDRERLLRELELFPVWYVTRHRGRTLGDAEAADLYAVFDRIIEVNLAEPRVFVHRDYHSRNLMLSTPNPGVLDFQDAVFGPISYDLVSLFKDAYIRWDEQVTLDWLVRYWERARTAGLPVRADFGDFFRDYEWMGVQRHLKVLGIFARLFHRDGKDGYLNDMPLVADYLRRACQRYREFGPLVKLLDTLEARENKTGYSF